MKQTTSEDKLQNKLGRVIVKIFENCCPQFFKTQLILKLTPLVHNKGIDIFNIHIYPLLCANSMGHKVMFCGILLNPC